MTNTEKISQVGARVDKTKEFLEKDINETREEIYGKIESNDHFCVEEFASIKSKASSDKIQLTDLITKLDEEFHTILNKETEDLKLFVNSITSAAQAHRETLQEKYNEKLGKIKDVCAQYFSKYEKHLMNQQELVKDLEKRQDKWVNTLIKPQEVNQARLFSIDSRIKEGELTRLKD